MMEKLIGYTQSSFIPGRQVANPIFLAQKIVDAMKKKKVCQGFMAVIIDLKKAYDRIEWDFLECVMRYTRFDDKFVRLIMRCT